MPSSLPCASGPRRYWWFAIPVAALLLSPATIAPRISPGPGPGPPGGGAYPGGLVSLPAVNEQGDISPPGWWTSDLPRAPALPFRRQAFFKSLDPRDYFFPSRPGAKKSGRGAESLYGIHVVRPGETLWRISRRYGVNPQVLAVLNGLADTNKILAGQRLLVPMAGGSYHRVRAGETLWRVADTYGVDPKSLMENNGISDPTTLQVGRILRIPARQRVTATATVAGGAAGNPAWPLVVTGTITSNFGPRWGGTHTGIDIAAPHGVAVRAAMAGTVVFAGWRGSYGRAVVIEHPGGWVTLYGHNSELLTATGQRVARGQIIARLGNSGRSTGAHLHFEVVKSGVAQDPLEFLRGKPDGSGAAGRSP